MAPDPTGGTTQRPAVPTTTRPAAAPPPQVTMGLLNYITVHSLDEDYAHVSQRRGERPEARAGRFGAAGLVILAVFGVLITTAGIQTARNAGSDAASHDELVAQIKRRSELLDGRRATVARLRQETTVLQQQLLEDTAEGRALTATIDRLGVRTGGAAVTGPGVRIVVDDAPNATGPQQQVLDKDLQKLVNALWEAGAEAITINGQRLSNLSAIRHAGSAITVNYRSLRRPYVVTAIGNPDSLPARFLETKYGAAWLDLQAAYGLRFDMTSEESLKMPVSSKIDLRYATVPERAR